MNLFYKKFTLYILLVSTIIMIVLMFLQGRPLKTSYTPAGIVSLELAPTLRDAEAVLDIWAEASTDDIDIIKTAVGNTWLDFAFLFFYSLLLFCAAKNLSLYFSQKKFWNLVAVASLAAGILDIIENIGMLQTLQEKGSHNIALMTAVAAYFKFILILLVLFFIVAGLLVKTFKRKKQTA